MTVKIVKFGSLSILYMKDKHGGVRIIVGVKRLPLNRRINECRGIEIDEKVAISMTAVFLLISIAARLK